jgi:hypothetical protein
MNGPLGTEGLESCGCSWGWLSVWGGRDNEVASLYAQVCDFLGGPGAALAPLGRRNQGGE